MADGKDESPQGWMFRSPGLAEAIEIERFKQFLDHVPLAIAVAET